LALEYKGIDYDTMFINLRDKPDWFLELVPSGLVPVAKVKDKLVHESYDILKVYVLLCYMHMFCYVICTSRTTSSRYMFCYVICICFVMLYARVVRHPQGMHMFCFHARGFFFLEN